ncbi:MAG TPA: hypothetical protein VIY47_09435, partial [Ignavibacteriaceae bacterium]
NEERTEDYEEIPNTIRRCKQNAIGVWGLVLDYDGSRKLEEVCDELEPFEFILYTTFRHTEQQHKFRVVLPFQQRATREELRSKASSITETFTQVDHASFSESQSFYLHSGATTGKAIYNEGWFLDLDWFEVEKIAVDNRKSSSDYDGDPSQYKQNLKDSLLTCSGLHYAGIGSKHGVLTLVALCKSAGLSYEEFDLICAKIAASDSSLQQQSLRKQAWKNWIPYSGITAKVREEFITSYGGRSSFNQPSEVLIERIRNKYKLGVKNGRH